MRKLSFLYFFFISCALLVPIAHGVTISTAIPGTNSNGSAASPGAFVDNFYQFALMIGGILAFGAIVFGGVKYMASAGNPSGQSDAKEWIWGALTGLVLLAGAYLILHVVNPQLVNLNINPLTPTNVDMGTQTSYTAKTSYGCIASNNVVACSPGNLSNCSDVPNGACSGKACTQVDLAQCGTTANSTTQGGGTTCSYYTSQASCQGASCQWSPATAFAPSSCHSVTAQGTVQNGGTCASTAECASGLTCVQYNHTCSGLAQNNACDSTCNAGLTCSTTTHTCVTGGPPVGNNSACTQCPPAGVAACGYTAPYCLGTCGAGTTCKPTSQTTVCSSAAGSITVPVVKCQ